MAPLSDLRAPVVLLVDDESLMRMMAADLLSDEGYRILEAANADEALSLLDLHPDVRVLFTDVDMPGTLDGFALARIVDMRWPGIGIIATSDKASPGRGDLPSKARFIQKPYASLTLLREVAGFAAPVSAPS